MELTFFRLADAPPDETPGLAIGDPLSIQHLMCVAISECNTYAEIDERCHFAMTIFRRHDWPTDVIESWAEGAFRRLQHRDYGDSIS